MAIYDLKSSTILHVSMYRDEDDCWRVYLGWPTRGEVIEAKKSGLRVISVTLQYTPPSW